MPIDTSVAGSVRSEDRYEELARAFRVLSDPMRLRILGALAERSMTGVELAGRLDLTPATISHHLSRLQKAHLVTATADGTSKHFALDIQFFDPRSMVVPTIRSDETSGRRSETERGRTLKNFFDGRRLKTIPARRTQLVIVVQELLSWFEPGRDYAEREVNEILREAHADVATLRREMVDYGYLHRAHGIYRVTSVLPERSTQLRQEMTGDEGEWLTGLLVSATRDAINAGRAG